MRNNSMYVNTLSTCQPNWDGLNWNVYLYDVTQAQLSTGWWVQIIANFTSSSLAYTSYVKAETNDVVEFQNSYTTTLTGYNTSRSIPPKLSWLDNRYVLYFHELQYKYLEAVSGQTTPYMKFRFRSPTTSHTSYTDYMRVILEDWLGYQAFTPINNSSNLVAQFLPALGPGDSDFGVGFSARATLQHNGNNRY